MTDGLKPYPEYKDSGLSWLGQIPAHWDEQRAKYFFRGVDQRSKNGEEELLSRQRRRDGGILAALCHGPRLPMVRPLEELFPSLAENAYQVTNPRDNDCNRIAWAAGDAHSWWWPSQSRRAAKGLRSEHPVLALIREKLPETSWPFTIIADLEAHPGHDDEVVSALAASEAIRLMRLEPGCMAYDICRDADSPDRFVAHECWWDLTALQNHLATPHCAAVGAALAGLLATAPPIRVLTSVAARALQ